LGARCAKSPGRVDPPGRRSRGMGRRPSWKETASPGRPEAHHTSVRVAIHVRLGRRRAVFESRSAFAVSKNAAAQCDPRPWAQRGQDGFRRLMEQGDADEHRRRPVGRSENCSNRSPGHRARLPANFGSTGSTWLAPRCPVGGSRTAATSSDPTATWSRSSRCCRPPAPSSRRMAASASRSTRTSRRGWA
jgi:hypothetical protein